LWAEKYADISSNMMIGLAIKGYFNNSFYWKPISMKMGFIISLVLLLIHSEK